MNYNLKFGETFVPQTPYMFEKDDIDQIAALLEDGGVICYPTDTIWGIGCDATNPEAIQKVSTLKGRKPNKGYVLLVSSIDMVKEHVEEMHPRIETLLGFHSRPLTLVYPKAKNLPKEVCAPDGSVAIRITSSTFCIKLIDAFGGPIVSTSANISESPFPTNFGEISSYIIENVDYVAKERRWDKAPAQPSTIGIIGNDGLLEFVRD